jgi:hypothetical protein
VAVESNQEDMEGNLEDVDVESNLRSRVDSVVESSSGSEQRHPRIAKLACSQLGQQPRSNNRLYSLPPNGPLFNGKEFVVQLLPRRSISKAEERSELGVLGYTARPASLLVDFPRCFVGCAIVNQARAIDENCRPKRSCMLRRREEARRVRYVRADWYGAGAAVLPAETKQKRK